MKFKQKIKQSSRVSTDNWRERKRRYNLGHRAEILAAIWLSLKGYKVIGRRIKTPAGEIDLIARKGRISIFIEVKARKTHDLGILAVDPKTQKRLCRAASYITAKENWHSHEKDDIRFDLMIFSKWYFRHILNAWSCNH